MTENVKVINQIMKEINSEEKICFKKIFFLKIICEKEEIVP